MEYLNLFLYLSIIVPLSIVLIASKKKTRTIVCFLMIGLTIAVICGELNSIIFKSMSYSKDVYSTTFAPMVEESLKMLPIFLYVFIFKPSRQDIIEGSIAVGVGFAIFENAFIFASNAGQIEILTAILRAFGAGMIHVITMLIVGFGISFVYERKNIVIPGSIGLIACAIIYHSIYNYLVCCNHKVLAFLMPTLIFIPAMILFKKISKDIE